jgi:hypothetical protein
MGRPSPLEMHGDLTVAAHEAHSAVGLLEPVSGELDDAWPVPGSDEGVHEPHLQFGLLLVRGAHEEDAVELPQHFRRGWIVERGHHMVDRGRQVQSLRLGADHGRHGDARIVQLLDQAQAHLARRPRHQNHHLSDTRRY